MRAVSAGGGCRRRRWLPFVAGTGATAVLAVVLVVALVGGAGPVRALVGRPAPALAGPSLGGAPIDLADHRGQVVLVNVWASWCASCVDELPLLWRTTAEWSTEGVVAVGLNTRDSTGHARRMLARLGIDLPSVVDEDGRKAVDWGVSGVPETFVVGRDGTVVARHVGPVTEDWLDAELAAAVAR